MTSNPPAESSRREFLTGQPLRAEVERAGDDLADQLLDAEAALPPSGGDTVRLETRAMACDFAVLMNPGPSRQILAASDALDLVHALEAQMTVYRDDSELAEINRRAAREPVEVEPRLFELLMTARRLAAATGGAFDPTSGPMIALWRKCRAENRVPGESELAECRGRTGIDKLQFDEAARTIRFAREGVSLDLGGIGKGYALDRIGDHLLREGQTQWLIHGGHSSMLARGENNRTGGWPVGLRHPLFPNRQFATIVLRDRALSSSGSGVQYFRHEGRRYGHILDPRTGWPVPPEAMLSVTVLASTAAEADALSTAFFVMGVENARRHCDNNPEVAALIVPPATGRTLESIVLNMPAGVVSFC
ncbi:MAG: FAD:protein FMN transferase [Planctomycetes bacterium]|nr:FAD:protein FMN transferase [Planctomycetota bacterium]